MSSKVGPITVEDYVAIKNMLGKYQWLVDDGKEEWVDLWTEDGLFQNGVLPPSKGTEQLKQIPAGVKQMYGDRMRHHLGSTYIEYGNTKDEAIARGYNMVTTWKPEEGAKFFCMALSTVHLVRQKGEWKVKFNDTKQLNNF
jgi:hypothetical protein